MASQQPLRATSRPQLSTCAWAGLAVGVVGKSLVCRHRRRRSAALRATTNESKGLRIFLDTADVQEWYRLWPLGIFFGVTTNPVLFQRAGVPCDVANIQELYKAAKLLPGMQEIMFQATGEDVKGLLSSALELFDMADGLKIVVKLPLTVAGVQAAALLKRESQSHSLCMTTCYSAQQGIIAGGLSAEYIAPYLGRMSDLQQPTLLGIPKKGWPAGLEECARLQAVVDGAGARTRVLVASVRAADQVTELATRGCDTFTLAPRIIDQLLDVKATYTAAQEFERAAKLSLEPPPVPEKEPSKGG